MTGSLGMTAAFSLLAIAPPNYWVTVSLLAAGGFFAGFYMIPLQSLLQVLTTDKDRGRFIAMNTVTTMIGFVGGNYLFSLGKGTLGLSPPTIYLFCAAVGAVVFFPLWLRWVPWFERAIAEADQSEPTSLTTMTSKIYRLRFHRLFVCSVPVETVTMRPRTNG